MTPGLRLARLDLTRYGHFEGASLDFGPARAIDVTVIYGDNEAGKSTAFAAWLDLLFGLAPRNHPYAFRHPRKELEIGARLDQGDVALDLRRKGSALMDGAGHALDPGRLSGLLRNLGRDAYASRFSLDEATLREGGEAIAGGKGDLGEALHLGSSGRAAVLPAIEALEARMAGFHRKGASKSQLAEGKRALAELKSAIEAAALPPEGWDGLQQALRTAGEAVEAQREALARAEAALQTRAQWDRIAALDRGLSDLDARLAGHPTGPDLPPGAEARLAELATEARGADEAIARLTPLIAQTEARRDALAPDAEALALAPALAGIHPDRVAAARTHRDHLPNRHRTASERAAARDAALARAALAALPFETAEAVEALGRTLLAAREAAHATAAADRAVAQAREATSPAQEQDAPPDPAPIQAALDALPPPDRLDGLDEARQAAKAALEAATTGLPRDWPDLVAAPGGLPEAPEVSGAVQALHAAKADHDRARADAAEARKAADYAALAQKAQAALPDLVTDAQRDAARAARDAAWDRHRADLAAETADAFAAAMRADDAILARFGQGETARLRLAQADEALAEKTAALARAEGATARAEQARATAQARADALARRLGLAPDCTPEALAPRLDRLRSAAGAQQALDRAEATLAQARARADAAEDALSAALPEGTEGDLRQAARDWLRRAERQAALAEAHAKAAAILAEAEARARDAKTDARDKAAMLADMIAGTALQDRPMDRLAQAMTPLREAIAAQRDWQGLQTRIADMESEISTLAHDLHAIWPSGGDPVAAYDSLHARVQEAQRLDAARKALDEQLDDQRANLKRAQTQAQAAMAQRAALLDGQGPGEPEALLARDLLRRERSALTRERAAIRADHGAALDALAGADGPPPMAALEAEAEAARAAYAEALKAQGASQEAFKSAQTGPGADAARAQRAGLLTALGQQARTAAAAAIGAVAARRALHRFEQENRASLLEAAEAAFARLTDGAWSRLETDSDGKGGLALYAVGRDGRTRIDGLSTGTRGQIYLALRLAGHAAFARDHGALPFVLDDVAETFDDTRARATLMMLGELGARGQAILLTHHRHLVEMARAAIPGVRVIDMPPRGPARLRAPASGSTS